MKGMYPYLLTWVDRFSKYAWVILIENKKAETVRNAILKVFIRGYLKEIQTDNGKEFANKLLEDLFRKYWSKHIRGFPYHP